jgi:hypothetical protein
MPNTKKNAAHCVGVLDADEPVEVIEVVERDVAVALCQHADSPNHANIADVPKPLVAVLFERLDGAPLCTLAAADVATLAKLAAPDVTSDAMLAATEVPAVARLAAPDVATDARLPATEVATPSPLAASDVRVPKTEAANSKPFQMRCDESACRKAHLRK